MRGSEKGALDMPDLQELVSTPEERFYLSHITERVQSEEALQRELDFISAVLDTAGALVVVLDCQGRIVRFNRACERTTGYSLDEVRGKLLWESLLDSEEVEPVKAVFDELRAGQFPNEYENYWLTKDGGRRLIAWSNTALLGAGGAVEYVVGTGIDITERRQAEEALRTAHDKLELRVMERSAELQKANQFLAALHETALGVVSRLDIAELLETVMERAMGLFDATYGLVYLVEPGEDELVLKVGTGMPPGSLGQRLKRGEGMAGKIYESGQAMALGDYHTWSGRSPKFPGPYGSVLGAPLMSASEVVGVLGVARRADAPAFRPDELDLIRRFSHLASIALDNARLYSSAQQQLVELRGAQHALQQRLAAEELAARISTEFVNLGPDEIDAGIQHALQAMGQVAGVDRSYAFQFSGDGTLLENTHEWCAEGIQPYIDSLQGLSRSAFPWFVGRLERFEVVSVSRLADLPPEANSERAECEREGIQSIILVPLTHRGILTGFLGFDSVRSQRCWGEDTIALLKTLAGIIVNALEHKRAQAIQAGQRQFLELLATGGDFSETLRSLVRLIEDQWPGMLGLILLLDEDGKHLHIGATVSLPGDYVQSIEGLEIGPMVGSCGTACYRRERVIVEDTATDPRWVGLRDLALQHGLRACWSEPVFSPDGGVVGTFAMYYRQPRAPTEPELRTIELGAHLVGVAVEHDRAERALRESEAKFRGIIEYANIGIAIVQDARVRFLNPHYAAMLGYSVEKMRDKEFMLYCAPEERDRIVDFYTRRARGEEVPGRYETAMMHRDGTRVYAEVSAGLIPYGGRQATFVFLRDITEEREAKRALEEALQTLEQRVEERTKELAALNVVSGVVSRSLDLNQIMGSALDKTMEVTNMEMGAAYLALVAGTSDGLPLSLVAYKLVAYRGLSEELVRAIERIPLRNSAMDQAAELGRPYVWHVADVPAQAGLADMFEKEGLGFAISIPLMAKGHIVGSMTVGTRQSRPVTSEVLSLLAAIGQQVGMAVENARLYEAEQERREEAEGRRRVAEGMREILAILNSRQSLHEILSFIATQTCRLLHSEAAAILRLEDDLLRIQASCGLEADHVSQIVVPLGTAAAGRALAERRPVIVPDLSVQVEPERRVEIPPEPYWTPLQQLVKGYRAVLAVPLIVKEEAYGAISLYYGEPREFSEEEVRLATSVADQVALAIENARLREQAGQAAAMEERGRLARELHDSVTQSLYSVTMYTEAAARLMTSGQEPSAAEYLRDARDTAQEALREMRLMIYQLRPPLLEKGGLAVALQVRLDAVERRGGIHAELTVQGEDRLPPAIQGELHQIAQEALNNALKHARARQVHVRLNFGDTATLLEIEDDGVGFALASVQHGGGLGIPGMKERVQRIAGRLAIESTPGQGTRVSVEVPSGGGK